MTNRKRWLAAVSALMLAAMLVLLSVFALSVNLNRLRDSFRWVQHTDEVLLQIAAVEENLAEAVASARGYLLIGDQDYLNAFRGSQAAVSGQITMLRLLVADNPARVEQIDRLDPMLTARFDELQLAVDLGPGRLDTATAAIRAARVRRPTTQIRLLLNGVRQDEIQLLRERQRSAEMETRWSTTLATMTAVLAVLTTSFGFLLFHRARTRHREQALRTELIHVSRLNMMGQTASMLAHELNQPLTATGNYLRAMLRLIEAPEPRQIGRITDALQRSVAQMDRAREIVQRLRRFIEKGEPAKTAEDVAPILEEAVSLLGMQRDGLTVSSRVDADVPRVLVDKVQIEQVLINLMRNAIEAMEQSSTRLLGVLATCSDGAMVRISVGDSGPGLAKEVADRLFQPFISTKSGGMGVGLSICHTIVTANGGRIWAEPNPQGGTVFCFTLPVAVGG